MAAAGGELAVRLQHERLGDVQVAEPIAVVTLPVPLKLVSSEPFGL